MISTIDLRRRPTTSSENIYYALEQRIYGTRTTDLSTSEINQLVQLPPDPILNLLIYRGFMSSALNPDVTVVQLISQTRTPSYLIAIALCLRAHADPNMYVRVPRLGVVHVLAYIYFTLSNIDSRLVDTIIVMFLAKGAKPDLPVFDDRITDPQGQIPASSLSVKEWISTSGYDNIFGRIRYSTFPDLQQSIDADSLRMISIVLNLPILTPIAYTGKDMSLALRALIPLDNIPINSTIEGLDFVNLNESVSALYGEGFNYLLQKGQYPSYILINRILVLAQKYRQELYILPAQECENMLIAAVSVGVSLDREQLQMLSLLGENTYQRVLKDYSIPTWRKICRLPASQPAPQILQQIAISVNIDPTLASNVICQELNQLVQAEPQALIEANRKRQEMRVSSELSTANTFLNGSLPSVVCSNSSLLPHNPYDYTDLHLAYYRDDQNAVWCFTSDMFINLLSTQINPYSKLVLPEQFLDLLRYKIAQLQRYGISTNTVQTFAQALENLKTPASEVNTTSNEIVQAFINLGAQYSVTANTLRNLTPEQMMAALRTINFPINLIPLSQSVALISTAYIVLAYVKKGQEVQPFFLAVRS